MRPANIKDVKNFWENQPLFVGESKFSPGTLEFFEDHTSLVVADCFAGQVDEKIFPPRVGESNFRVLDAGCGIGFWLEQFSVKGFTNVTGLDISSSALHLAQSRMVLFGFRCELVEGNLEELPFANEEFSHVNCQGVLHHTPNPGTTIAEIARVLKPGGTASISVYYENFLIRNFDRLKPFIRLFGRVGFGLKGRGRESILFSESAEELVRKYDGVENPVGISYTRNDFEKLVSEHFEIRETFLHFFPRRVFSWVPRVVHRLLDRHFGFMIYGSLVKKSTAQRMDL